MASGFHGFHQRFPHSRGRNQVELADSEHHHAAIHPLAEEGRLLMLDAMTAMHGQLVRAMFFWASSHHGSPSTRHWEPTHTEQPQGERGQTRTCPACDDVDAAGYSP